MQWKLNPGGAVIHARPVGLEGGKETRLTGIDIGLLNPRGARGTRADTLRRAERRKLWRELDLKHLHPWGVVRHRP